MRPLFTIGWILLAVISAAAVESDSLHTPAIQQPAFSFFDILRVIFILGLILFLIFAAIWILKKVSPGVMRGTQGNVIKILSSTYLGPKKALYLIEVFDRVILVGMTDNSVNALAEFTDRDKIGEYIERKSLKSAGSGFASILSSFLQKGAK